MKWEGAKLIWIVFVGGVKLVREPRAGSRKKKSGEQELTSEF
jgi:hypothetical protein